MIKPLNESEWSQYAAILDTSSQLLPFFDTHTEARQAFIEHLQQADGSAYLIYRKKRPFFFITIKGNNVTNLLLCQSVAVGWQTIFQFVEKMIKQGWCKSCRFQVKHPLTPYLRERFVASGYELDETGRVAEKILEYRTALVLGGGGARGAYQIGVWQALRELRIPFALITGTSVGALNGALILQNDFEAAKRMWEKIETNNILSFPTAAASSDTLSSLLHQLGSLTHSALFSKGVSTAPLRQLINETFSETTIQQTSIDFYLVTTQLQNMREQVIHFNQCQDQQWQAWLLASSSFFPAMAATKIGTEFYIDGGYRNNIPCDVALAHGATEYIVVDVKGPGISKPTTLPETSPFFLLKTPWSMGNVLLFDGVRSRQNIQLGYLEASKAFTKKYQGYWYTVQATVQEISSFQQAFFGYLKETYQLNLWYSITQQKKVCQKLRKLYKANVSTEILGLVLLELLAKLQGVRPTSSYTLSELSQYILRGEQEASKQQGSIGLLSVQEWLQNYYTEYFLLSEKQQINWLKQYLDAVLADKPARLVFLIDKVPILVLQVLMVEFISKGGVAGWHKNFHMKS